MRPFLTGLAVLVAGLSAAFPDPTALTLVRRAIERDGKTTYSCVRILQTWRATEPIRVRRDQASSGANRITVLSPLSKQGYTSVDNGKQWVSYYPDSGRVFIQDSPLARMSKDEYDRRFELLKSNYDVTSEGTDRIAGRPAVVVRLKPSAHRWLYLRRYWIDSEKSVLLRVEWTHPDGTKRVMSETISIQFPKSLPADTFDPRFVSGPEKPQEVRVMAPVRHLSLAALEKAVEFKIVNPVKMPFGFTFTGGDAIKTRSGTMAALRYTDGAANVTLFQRGEESRGSSRRHSFKADDTWLTVDDDELPEGGREILTKSLKSSTAERDAELRERAASLYGAEGTAIEALRDSGLGYDHVVLCLAASRGSRKSLDRFQKILLQGKGVEGVARESGVSEVELLDALKRFWGMRQS